MINRLVYEILNVIEFKVLFFYWILFFFSVFLSLRPSFFLPKIKITADVRINNKESQLKKKYELFLLLFFIFQWKCQDGGLRQARLVYWLKQRETKKQSKWRTKTKEKKHFVLAVVFFSEKYLNKTKQNKGLKLWWIYV